jgi:MFS family permease
MDGPGATPADANPRATPRQVAAVVCGNALEFYDFLTFSFFAASIGHAFFPGDQTHSLLASLATFGVGFVMRPVGALVLGRLGDRHGRKPAMLLSFGLMGLGMVGLALTPGYAAIGPAAQVLAVLWRLIQGFALGGEVGPTTAFLAEAAPPGLRGVFVSFQLVGQRAAALAAGLAGLGLSHLMPAQLLDAWGWRVAFLLGAVIIPFGLVLRSGLVETLAGHEQAEPGRFEGRAVIGFALLAVVVMIGGTVTSYITDYLTTYATQTLGMGASVSFAAPVASGVTGVLVAPLAGWLTDRIGRKPVMLGSWVIVLVGAIPMFTLLEHSRSLLPLIVLSAGLSACMVSAISALLSSLGEGLPMRVRSGALGLAYAGAVAAFGGSAQYAVAWLTKQTHSPLAPAWYLTAAVGVSFLAMLAMPETAPPKAGGRAQRQTSDARIAA